MESGVESTGFQALPATGLQPVAVRRETPDHHHKAADLSVGARKGKLSEWKTW